MFRKLAKCVNGLIFGLFKPDMVARRNDWDDKNLRHQEILEKLSVSSFRSDSRTVGMSSPFQAFDGPAPISNNRCRGLPT
jgi:hypothetical protein